MNSLKKYLNPKTVEDGLLAWDMLIIAGQFSFMLSVVVSSITRDILPVIVFGFGLIHIYLGRSRLKNG